MKDPKEILAQMTLEEKAAICDGADFWHLKAMEKYGIPSIMVCDGPHGLRVQSAGGDNGVTGSEPAATIRPQVKVYVIPSVTEFHIRHLLMRIWRWKKPKMLSRSLAISEIRENTMVQRSLSFT